MATQRKSPLEFSVEDLDRELIARGAQVPDEKKFKFKDREGTPEREAAMSRVKELYETSPPLNEDLAHIGTLELGKIIIFKTRSTLHFRQGTTADEPMDWYEISDEQIKHNTDCIAAVMLEDNLINEQNGFSSLKVKNYGKTFNLCDYEPFHDQPILKGMSVTGFLVNEDTIATAGHVVKGWKIADLRFVFGFRMDGPYKPVIRVPNRYIYKGVEVSHKVHHSLGGDGADWALVKLDRRVLDHPAAKLSRKKIFCDQPIYVIGHPLGLPLKFSTGASVRDVHETYFAADLNVFCGNSGSPVFGRDTNEVIGMVVRGYNKDFRWTGKCWISIGRRAGIYGEGAHCIRVSEFIKYC